MQGPDFVTPQEQKDLDRFVDLQIDQAIEEKHIHEVVQDDDLDEADA